MATINLGSIKFNWQGSYSGSTAYSVDDVVSYNGSSYICKLASTGNLPTNTTYWDQMSQAGTDGTDLTSTLTTQGDIVYRDASGLARLAAGTSGQFLKTLGTGANPIWGDAGGGLVQTVHASFSNTQTLAINNQDTDSTFTIGITPTSASNKILLTGHIMYGQDTGYGGHGLFFKREKSGASNVEVGSPTGGGSSQKNYHTSGGNTHSFGDGSQFQYVGFHVYDTPNTTDALTYRVCGRGVPGTLNLHFNRNGDSTQRGLSVLIAQEIV